jgi:hypothetical protein
MDLSRGKKAEVIQNEAHGSGLRTKYGRGYLTQRRRERKDLGHQNCR